MATKATQMERGGRELGVSARVRGDGDANGEERGTMGRFVTTTTATPMETRGRALGVSVRACAECVCLCGPDDANASRQQRIGNARIESRFGSNDSERRPVLRRKCTHSSCVRDLADSVCAAQRLQPWVHGGAEADESRRARRSCDARGTAHRPRGQMCAKLCAPVMSKHVDICV